VDNDVWRAGRTPVPDVQLSVQDKRWEGYEFSDGTRVVCVPLDYSELKEVLLRGDVQVRLALLGEGQTLLRLYTRTNFAITEEEFSSAAKHGSLVVITTSKT